MSLRVSALKLNTCYPTGFYQVFTLHFFNLIESSDDIGEIIYILHMKKGSERPSDLLHVTPQIRGKASI